MNNISFLSRVLESRKVEYEITATDNTGRDAWYILEVFPEKKFEFEKMLRLGTLKLDDYGVILKSGYGKMPPKEDLD